MSAHSWQSKGGLFLLVTGLALLAFIFFQSLHPTVERESDVASSTGDGREGNAQGKSVILSPDSRRISNQRLVDEGVEEKGDLNRVYDATKLWEEDDRVYRLRFERHRSIKIYQNAPCRNYPKY
jgi:hypothetical protein